MTELFDALFGAEAKREDARPRPMRPTYRIESRDEHGVWSPYGLGDAWGYDSVEQAEAAIEGLRELGGSWATAEYRVVPVLS